jgi:hypothetical protein
VPYTGAIPPAAAPPWSGLSGASGDPTMTAEAIRAAAANFHICLAQLWPQAAKRGVSRATFLTYTTSLTPDLRIMDLLDNQPEFTRSVWGYLDLLVNETRIEKGRAFLAKYRATFEAVERAYGVDRTALPDRGGDRRGGTARGGVTQPCVKPPRNEVRRQRTRAKGHAKHCNTLAKLLQSLHRRPSLRDRSPSRTTRRSLPTASDPRSAWASGTRPHGRKRPTCAPLHVSRPRLRR